MSAVVLGLSLAGRWYAPKLDLPRIPFTVSALSKTLLKRSSGPCILLLEHPLEGEEVPLHFIRAEVLRVEP